MAVMSYRANRQASTKYYPFFLLFGKQMRLPIEHDTNPISNKDEFDYSIEEEIDNRLKSLLKMESVLASSKLNLKPLNLSKRNNMTLNIHPLLIKSVI